MAGRLKVRRSRDLDSYNFNPAIRAQIEAKLREQGVDVGVGTSNPNADPQPEAQNPKGGKRIPLEIFLIILGACAVFAWFFLTHKPGV